MEGARFSVDEASERLEELIDRALLGETIVIEAANGFLALLQRFEPAGPADDTLTS
ncbi:MAG: hypothetical protein ABW194_08040 [Novosphingobium sp.]